MSASDVADVAIPPPLADSPAPLPDLPTLVEAGGAAYAALLDRWRMQLGVEGAPAISLTLPLRAEAILTLLAEAQARRILAGRPQRLGGSRGVQSGTQAGGARGGRGRGVGGMQPPRCRAFVYIL